jgi:TolB protein
MKPIASRYRPSSSRLLSVLLFALCAGALLLAGGAIAEDPARQIVIGGTASTLAVPDCAPRGSDAITVAACRTITDVLRADLRFEDIRLVPDNLYHDLPTFNPEALKFDDWKAARADILVVTRAEPSGSGDLTVEVRVYAVGTGQQIMAKRYSDRADNPRAFAHQAADDVMTLTQFKGIARSKIAFVSDRDSVPKGKKTKEVYIADYDGFNARRLTVNRSLNILPTWKPDGKAIGYISYRTGFPELFIAWIYEGRSTDFAPGKGFQVMSLAFSPDGKKIAYSSNKSGNTDVWVANADGTDPRRLTSSPAIDTAPRWSPTGNEIAFTSQRSGTPQIWVMDSEGLNPRRVSSYGTWNDHGVWNPAKEYSEIAYTSRIEGGFEVAVLDLAGGPVRQITEGRGSCEYPSWAPNGRHLVFACNHGGRNQLTIADRKGQTVRTIDVGPGDNVQPDWGP